MSAEIYDWAYERLLCELGYEPTEQEVQDYIDIHGDTYYENNPEEWYAKLTKGIM